MLCSHVLFVLENRQKKWFNTPCLEVIYSFLNIEIRSWTITKNRTKKLELLTIYQTLRVYNTLFTKFMHTALSLSTVSHEIFIICSAFAVIKVNRVLNPFCLIGVAAAGFAILLVLGVVLEKASDMRKESNNFIIASKSNLLKFAQYKKTEPVYSNTRALREISICLWNIPIHEHTFHTIATDIILECLVTLLLTF